MSTKIEWVRNCHFTKGETWNPITGCTPVSDGCQNCYARRMANRLTGRFGYPADDPFAPAVHLDKLREPLTWRKPRMVFVCSMGDMFHAHYPQAVVDHSWAVMASCGQHVFQVLTKRAGRMKAYIEGLTARGRAAAADYERRIRRHFERYKMKFTSGYSLPSPPTPELRAIYDAASEYEGRPKSPNGATLEHGFSGHEYHWRPWPLNNVWLGVTTENQRTADERIPILLDTPAAVRFVSVEPMLGPVDLRMGDNMGPDEDTGAGCVSCDIGGRRHQHYVGERCGRSLDWVICGGETGPGARPMDPEWARDLRDQCKEAGVPFFFKQMGGYPRKKPIPKGLMVRQWPGDQP
ncbi:MAG TPA: phage Gp37/Gp68 family protein [Phycisphaerae bacterium]|nr:phage Gp37/Gp68 family protein [Phycisphaerae bacterium]